MSTVTNEVSNGVATLIINSPPANALSSILLRDLAEQFDTIERAREPIKAIVLKGEGKFFSAGADIKEFTSLQNKSDYQKMSEKGQQLFDRIENFSIPVIAAIHGAALGGGLELAMACHIRIVTEHTKLGLPELTLGIIPGFAGTQRLPQYVGLAKAYEMILSGQPINATQAEASGLVNRVVSEDELNTIVAELANQIATKSKKTISSIMGLIPYAKSGKFAEGIQAEAKVFGEVFDTEDAREGVQAFIEKRKPNFQDK